MKLHSLATRALPSDVLCGLDESECASVDRIARAIEASGYGSAATHRTAILRAIGDHMRTYDDAREALRWLASLDHRLATWGACACAREALRFVQAGEERPLLAIETTERWIAGLATLDDVQRAQDGAWKAWRGCAAYYAAYAYAAYAAYAAAAYAAYAAAAYAAYAYAANARAPAWDAARIAELTRLVGVVADALPGLPEEIA